MNHRNFVYLFLLLFLSFCTVSPLPYTGQGNQTNIAPSGALTLEEKEALYPHYKIRIKDFLVSPKTSAGAQGFQKRITIAEKKRIFRYLDDIKFVINSDEYAEHLLTYPMKPTSFSEISSVFSYPTKINYEEVFNKEKMLSSIRSSEYELTIQKEDLTDEGSVVAAAATATKYGTINGFEGWYPVYSLMDSLEILKSAKATVSIYNTLPWDSPEHNLDHKILQHEIKHTLGYKHDMDKPSPSDVTSGSEYLDIIFNDVWRFSDFQQKYAKEIQAFRGYYEEKYRHLLREDTVLK